MANIKRAHSFNEISNVSDVIIHIIFIIVALLAILPIILIFMASITDDSCLISQGYTFFPKKMTTSTYQFLFSGASNIISAYRVTIIATVLGTLISTTMTMLYAYPISRKSFKYRNTFSFILFFTMLFQGGLVPWYILYVRYLHIDDTLLALIMPGFVSAFNCLVVKTFFRTSLPDEILDAAKVDGASEYLTFIRIVIPLSTPAIATIALFQALYYWNDWYNCMLFIKDQNLYNLQYLLYQTLKSIDNAAQAASRGASATASVPAETLRMAMAIVSIGPIILAYPFFQRFFVKGLTIGAVKG